MPTPLELFAMSFVAGLGLTIGSWAWCKLMKWAPAQITLNVPEATMKKVVKETLARK